MAQQDVVERLAKCEVTSPSGTQVNISTLWQNKKALSDFEAKNVHLVFVGNGVPAKAKEYMKTLGIQEGELYTDEERITYQALNFDNPSFFKMISIKGIKLSREASAKGYKVDAGSGTGSWTQLGGVLAVDSGRLSYFHKCSTPYDYPDVDEVLSKL